MVRLLRQEAHGMTLSQMSITAEAYGCRDGVNLICNLNLNLKVILGTDMTLWKTRNDNRSRILSILHQIEELCRMCISFEVIHVKREANMAAHVTAKNASPLSAVNTWLYQVPEFLRACIQHDADADNE